MTETKFEFEAKAPGEKAEATKAFWVKCPACNHCWAAAYYPMEASMFAKLALTHSQCPKCGEKKSFVAKQEGGVLMEPLITQRPRKP